MGLIYTANCGWEEAAEYVLSVDDWGLDSMTRTYEGRTDELETFLRTLTKNLPDYQFPELVLIGKAVERGRAFSRVSCEFRGLLGADTGKPLPDPVINGGWRLDRVQLQSSTNAQMEIEYNSPFTSYRYVTRQRPTQQQFPGKLLYSKGAFEIFKSWGTKGNVFIGGSCVSGYNIPVGTGVPIDPAELGNVFVGSSKIITSSMTSNQVGIYWENTEENQGVIVPAEILTGNFAFQS